ncbi:hypothetical protein E4U34_005601 [Claviceps purpurea]|nr:hypothetical protein E4U34_005601 [Claviceps purpurea]
MVTAESSRLTLNNRGAPSGSIPVLPTGPYHHSFGNGIRVQTSGPITATLVHDYGEIFRRDYVVEALRVRRGTCRQQQQQQQQRLHLEITSMKAIIIQYVRGLKGGMLQNSVGFVYYSGPK